MELSEENINEIRDIILSTKGNIKRSNLYIYIFCSLKDHLDFLYDVNMVISKKKKIPAYFSTQNNKIYINPDTFYEYCLTNVNSMVSNLKIEESSDLLKYVYALVILHEVTHVLQVACAKYNYSKYSEINKLYNAIYKNNLLFKINYARNAEEFCMERNANLNAFKYCIDIVPEKYKNVMEINFLYNYLYNYEEKSNPSRKTYKMIGKKYDINAYNIPIYERLMHGLDLTEEEYKYFIEYFYDGELSSVYYNELNKRLLMR